MVLVLAKLSEKLLKPHLPFFLSIVMRGMKNREALSQTLNFMLRQNKTNRPSLVTDDSRRVMPGTRKTSVTFCVKAHCHALRLLGVLLFGLVGCVPRPENEVVLYTAVDREYAAPILDAFERAEQGVEISRQFDVEATKTLGLVNRIIQEGKRPRCDVFWNNEILHTIRLQKQGLLVSRNWKIPSGWPTGFAASDGTWVGFAARGRVLLVNKDKIPNEADFPKSVSELADAKWQGKCGVAFPLYGTTATHFAVLASQSKSNEAEAWFQKVRANATVLAGNKQVAQAVSSGQLAWGLTDTDDANIERENGLNVAIVFPDQLPDQLGTLFLPCSVAVLKDAPHRVAANLLADYLVSEKTETRLTMSSSAHFPVWPGSTSKSTAAPSEPIRWMTVDFEKAADSWESLAPKLAKWFE
jgi:iron(III) transport system substrate-binding protein